MALGDYSNNNGSNSISKVYTSTYYSRIKIKNRDKLVINFNYSNGLLKVIVSEETEDYKTNPISEINLSPTKAKMLSNRIGEFIDKMKAGEPIDPDHGVGVDSGFKETVSFIAFKVTGNRPDVPEHSFIIGKVNSQGVIQNSVEFVFNVDYDYSLTWTNIDNMQVEKEINQFMGIQTFKDVLDEYTRNSAGGAGASVWDTGRYDMNKILKSFYPIWDKLGIERYKGNKEGDSFFDKQGNANMNPPERAHSSNKSYEEIQNMLED